MKKIALSVLTSCLIIGTINTAYSAKEKMSVDLSYLNSLSKEAKNYEDSVDIINSNRRTIDCSNVVKREETRNSSCGANYVGSAVERRRVYGSGKIQVNIGQKLSCDNTADGKATQWETVSSNCHYLPICNYEKEVTENRNCKNGNTISTYKITSIYNGKHTTETNCAAHTTKTLIATESCNAALKVGDPPEKNIIDKTPKPHFTPTNNPDDANIGAEFDSKGRLTKLRIRDNRILVDGIYYKEIAINFSKENIKQLVSAKVVHANFDDWLEVKMNGSSVFSGPFEDERYIVLCKSGQPVIENANGTSDLLTINDTRLRNYLDERSLNYFKQGELSVGGRLAFQNNHSVSKNNDCTDNTEKHAEQMTRWDYRDGLQYFIYHYDKAFNYINKGDMKTYNAKNFADKLVVGKNRLVTQMIVADIGGMDYTIKFEYKD